MPRKVILYIAIGIVLFTVLVLYLLKDPVSVSKKIFAKAKAYDNWEESFDINEKEANGISFFNELLEFKTKKAAKTIDVELDSTALQGNKTSYFFIGDQFQLTTKEFDSLLQQVNKGSNLFLSYKKMSTNMHDRFFSEAAFLWVYSESVSVKAKNKLKLSSVFQEDTVATAWNVFSYDKVNYEDLENLNNVYSISEILDYSNFLDFEVGEGHIYLHSNPELFQNYQLLSPNGFEYANFVVDHIPENHQIKWLEIGKFDEEDFLNNQNSEGSGGNQDDSFLQFIFQNKALTIALLISILGIILFVIFRTKRNQNIVPYEEKEVNQSLVFAETIKEIYYKQQTPFSILQVIKKNFYLAVHKKFFVYISKENRDEDLKLLAEKSTISPKEIQELIQMLENKAERDVDFAYLEKVSKMQQEFYARSGVIRDNVKRKLQEKDLVFNRKMLFPILFICTGIFILLYGFYLLHLAKGIGIAMWPIGILVSGIGIRLFQLPVLKVSKNKLYIYKLFGAKTSMDLFKVEKVYFENNKTIVESTESKKHLVSHEEISVYEKEKYQEFILPLIHKNYDERRK